MRNVTFKSMRKSKHKKGRTYGVYPELERSKPKVKEKPFIINSFVWINRSCYYHNCFPMLLWTHEGRWKILESNFDRWLFKKSIYRIVHQSAATKQPWLFPPYVRVASVLDVFALSYDWFTRLSAPAVIGYKQVFFVSSFKPSVVFRF